jgi:hypothetical protein
VVTPLRHLRSEEAEESVERFAADAQAQRERYCLTGAVQTFPSLPELSGIRFTQLQAASYIRQLTDVSRCASGYGHLAVTQMGGIMTRTRRLIVALIAAAGLVGGSATAVTVFASASAAPAHVSAAGPDTWYYG